LICLRRWKPGAPTRCRRWRDRPHRLGLTTDRDHKFSAGLCRRCHDQALTPTSILCPASASAATGISRCIRPVPTMPVRRSLSVRRPGFSPHPPELHTAGRRIALKPPYPAHRPLLRSLRRWKGAQQGCTQGDFHLRDMRRDRRRRRNYLQLRRLFVCLHRRLQSTRSRLPRQFELAGEFLFQDVAPV
jgi:hypothetical protein